MRLRGLLVTVVAAVTALASAWMTPSVRADEGGVSFPNGYRAWTFLHSSLVPGGFPAFAKAQAPCGKPCTNGIFYFYANDPAMKGLRTGVYADGAIIVEELLEYQVGEKGNGGEGRRVMTGVMVKNSQRFAATDGWGYGIFYDGKVNTLDAKAQQECHQCHVSRKDNGYVFTKYAER